MKAKFTITGEIELDECYLEGKDKMSVKSIQEAITEELMIGNQYSYYGEVVDGSLKTTVTISQ